MDDRSPKSSWPASAGSKSCERESVKAASTSSWDGERCCRRCMHGGGGGGGAGELSVCQWMHACMHVCVSVRRRCIHTPRSPTSCSTKPKIGVTTVPVTVFGGGAGEEKRSALLIWASNTANPIQPKPSTTHPRGAAGRGRGSGWARCPPPSPPSSPLAPPPRPSRPPRGAPRGSSPGLCGS